MILPLSKIGTFVFDWYTGLFDKATSKSNSLAYRFLYAFMFLGITSAATLMLLFGVIGAAVLIVYWLSTLIGTGLAVLSLIAFVLLAAGAYSLAVS